MPRWTGNLLLLLGSLVVTVACMEAAMALALAYPGVLPRSEGLVGKPLTLVSHYYKNRNRKVVQYLPDCARYDPELTYTLRPAESCRVVNPDHVVEYSANQAGLRDSDEALDRPGAVVIGDSHAMGAGVEAAESFPKQLERRLGGSVLNAGVSSYGTARQLRLLERLELAPFDILVIQYCENDFRENRAYVERGELRIMSEPDYRALVDHHVEVVKYYPFKHVRSMLGALGRALRPREPADTRAGTTDTTEARDFLEVLDRHRHLIEGRTVLVVELNGAGRDDGAFVGALHHLLAQPRYAGLARWITAIDVSPELEPADYLRLDGHMKPSGHGKVARVLAEELKRRGFGSAVDRSRLRSSRQPDAHLERLPIDREQGGEPTLLVAAEMERHAAAADP